MLFNKKESSSGKSTIQLENENKQLRLNIMTITDQLENFKKIATRNQENYNKLVKMVNCFCRMLLDNEFAMSQLGGSSSLADMNIFDMIEYAQENYKASSLKERNLLVDLTNRLKGKDLEIEGLKAQISRYMLKEQQLKEFGHPEEELELSIEEDKAEVTSVSPKETEKETVNEEVAAKISPVHKPSGIMRMTVIEDEEDEGGSAQLPKNTSDPVPALAPVSAPTVAPVLAEPKKAPKSVSVPDLPVSDSSVSSKSVPVAEPDTEPVSGTKPAVVVTEEKEDKDNNKKDLKKGETLPTIQSAEKQKAVQRIEDMKTRVKQEPQNAMVVHVVNLNDIINNMNDVMWEVLVAIGRDGVSESKDIKSFLVKMNVSDTVFANSLAQLNKMGVIEQEKINTGWRWFYTYELTDVGKRIYIEKFKDNAVECERQLLRKEHTTALHGYTIKDASYILRAVFNYDVAVTDRKSNTMKLHNGEIFIPDIVAKKQKVSVVDYFEVELGHHTQEKFNNKCDKMRMVTKDLYFIVPDADTMNKILVKQIGQWVLEKGGKDKMRNTTIYLTTLTKLNEGKWENIYPF